MKRLQSAGLKFNIDKCKFAVSKIEYLGYIITWEVIKLDPKKLKQLSILNALRIKTGEAVPRHSTILTWLMAEAQWDIGTAYVIDSRWAYKKCPHKMDLSLHRGNSTNKITHCQGDHPSLSGFLKKHNPHRRIGRATGRSNHARR